MTLIELLVAMVIGLGITLAVSSLVVVGENHKRTTTSTNDAEQTGAYAFFALDKALRSAGSSLVETAYGNDRGVFGCRLNVTAASLPTTTAFQPPFNTFLGGNPSSLRVAPLLIAKNQSSGGSDVLVVMGGSGAAGGISRQVTNPGTANTLLLDNTIGFAQYDLALVSEGGGGVPDCLLEEVSQTPAVGSSTLNLGLTYYTTGSTTSIATLSANTSANPQSATYVTPLGNAKANNVQFQLFGVDGNRTLYSYDLLQNVLLVQGTGGTVSQAIADGVQEMHAIYGVDSNGDGKQDTWADASLTGATANGYDIANVMSNPGTLMHNILAVRVALVLRGEYPDKNQVSPATLTLFSGYTNGSGVSLTQTVNLQPNDQYYRYRVFEFTVPVRNMLLLAGAPPPT